MAWTAPKTWAVNEVVTSANMNTHIRDNENWLANDKPRCSAIRNTNQSIPDTTNTEVTLTATDEYDVGAMHDPGGGTPARLTVPSGGGGLYRVTANVIFAAVAGGNRFLFIWKNGAGVSPEIGVNNTVVSGAGTRLAVSVDLTLAAADWVTIAVSQTSGGAVNITDARLQARWVAF